MAIVLDAAISSSELMYMALGFVKNTLEVLAKQLLDQPMSMEEQAIGWTIVNSIAKELIQLY